LVQLVVVEVQEMAQVLAHHAVMNLVVEELVEQAVLEEQLLFVDLVQCLVVQEMLETLEEFQLHLELVVELEA
jgi:hypothetical protein